MFNSIFQKLSLSEAISCPDRALEMLCELARLRSGKSAALYSIEQCKIVRLATAPKSSMPRIVNAENLQSNDSSFFNRTLSSRLGFDHKATDYFKILDSNSVVAFLVTERSDPHVAFDAYERLSLQYIASIAQRLLQLEMALVGVMRGAMTAVERSKI